jgi:transposase
MLAAATGKLARRPLPGQLPREIQMHEPEHDGCPACGAALSELGEAVSEVQEYVQLSLGCTCRITLNRTRTYVDW